MLSFQKSILPSSVPVNPISIDCTDYITNPNQHIDFATSPPPPGVVRWKGPMSLKLCKQASLITRTQSFQYLRECDAFKDRTGPFRTIPDHLGPYGTLRNRTEPYSTIRDHMVPYTGPYGKQKIFGPRFFFEPKFFDTKYFLSSV